MDVLSSSSLDWARTHVERFGDTDLFPVPFEFAAIAHAWNWLRPYLQQTNLQDYRVGSDQRVLIPKPGSGFRVAVQLDPLDTLVYTAAIFEASRAVEKSRIAADQRIACSYRVQLDANGNFFPPENGWPEFHKRSVELAISGQFTHVLIADIADFYNQIYHHRVENALEMASVPSERARNIEKFISNLSAKQSRGLPVGPTASIILAEAALNDVDLFLLRRGATHVRYVDDFRVFCASRREALELQHALTEYLYTAHRLSLNPSKTHIIYVQRFIDSELRDPDEEEQRGKTSKFNELVAAILDNFSPYENPDGLVDEDDVSTQAARESLVELFDDCVRHRPLHLGLARHLLRKARRIRTSVLNEVVFDSLEVLAPVMRDAARYIMATVPKRSATMRGDQLIKFIDASDIGFSRYVKLWVFEILLRRPDMTSPSAIVRFADAHQRHLGIRAMAQVAKDYGLVDWVCGEKETWQNHSPRDRRAIVWAASTLPIGERRHWLKFVEENGEPLERAVAQFASS